MMRRLIFWSLGILCPLALALGWQLSAWWALLRATALRPGAVGDMGDELRLVGRRCASSPHENGKRC